MRIADAAAVCVAMKVYNGRSDAKQLQKGAIKISLASLAAAALPSPRPREFLINFGK
jgi:hypothetical protein